MLPKVNFCGLDVTKLIIGANPFGGFSLFYSCALYQTATLEDH